MPKSPHKPEEKSEADLSPLARAAALARTNAESVEFDWSTLERALGEFEEGADPVEKKNMALALKQIFDWVFTPMQKQGKSKKTLLELIGRRAVAIGWVVNPSRFGNDPSMTRVGGSFGLHKAVLSEITADCSREFGVRNKHQAHGSNFKKTPMNATKCKCRRCLTDNRAIKTGTLTSHGMILCEICGNKRCPHATDHRHECTNSNEPGQTGSIFA